ncbi:MAG TPA: DUF6776 family protein [Casimicrobiaceae bacterium]|jgi:hypothetical protein
MARLGLTMAFPINWRRFRAHFGISAPRMTVTTSLPWWERSAALLALGAVMAGMLWWSFGVGQLFGSAHRTDVDAQIAALETEASRLRSDASALRVRYSQMQSDLAMSRGAQQALSRQIADLTAENAALKEEATILQRLIGDTGKQTALSISRLSVERDAEGAYRYRMLVVRDASPRNDFEGHVALEAELRSAETGARRTLILPDDEPETRPTLALKFKYYQRVEGMLHVPHGVRLTALTARAFENGSSGARVTRTLTNP